MSKERVPNIEIHGGGHAREARVLIDGVDRSAEVSSVVVTWDANADGRPVASLVLYHQPLRLVSPITSRLNLAVIRTPWLRRLGVVRVPLSGLVYLLEDLFPFLRPRASTYVLVGPALRVDWKRLADR